MRLIHHLRRQVEPRDVNAPRGEVRGHVSRATTELDDPALVGDGASEGVEEIAVEGLVLEFAGDLLGVPLRDGVIRGAGVILAEQAGQPPPPTGPVGRL